VFLFFWLCTHVITCDIHTRYKRHLLSFRNSNTKSQLAQYLLADSHTFGKVDDIMDIKHMARSLCFLVRASSYIPISRPTDATCDRFLFTIYMCITLHVSSIKRSSSGVPHRTYNLQFLCLCLSAALSCKKLSYKTVPQTDTNTETGGSMYGNGLLMMSAWHLKHVELYTYR
jgi:hypothetical protein